MKNNKYRRIDCSPELLIGRLHLPPETNLVRMGMNEYGQAVFIVEHPDFPEVPEGEKIKSVQPRFTINNHDGTVKFLGWDLQ